jgi:hypothetical protein
MFAAAKRKSSLLTSRAYPAPPSKVRAVAPVVVTGLAGAERERANFAMSAAFSAVDGMMSGPGREGGVFGIDDGGRRRTTAGAASTCRESYVSVLCH